VRGGVLTHACTRRERGREGDRIGSLEGEVKVVLCELEVRHLVFEHHQLLPQPPHLLLRRILECKQLLLRQRARLSITPQPSSEASGVYKRRKGR
jgi:hypothetical protein